MDKQDFTGFFKKSIVMACALTMSAQAYGDSYFGFAPSTPDLSDMRSAGHGKNGYSEAAITIDPVGNPVAKALKGSKIVGLRCYMRSDYCQKNKRTSAVNVRHGSLSNDPEKFYADFNAGWNDIMLETPVVIGDEPVYIGPMVYETSGNPNPFVAAPGPSFSGGFNVSLSKGEWQEYSTLGNLLVQAIIDKAPADMPFAAGAALADVPLVVAPESSFSCTLAIHNFSGVPVESVEVTTVADNGATVLTSNISLDSPIASFDTRAITASLKTGSLEGTSVSYTVGISKINGKAVDVQPTMSYNLHVTKDAFLRIPLVEEFTSQLCTNCPFMIYYLDRAREQFGKPNVYITRHAGFVKDYFTISEDESLVYLFGTKQTFNPAVMYDRTIFEENGTTPVSGASVASTQPYLDALRAAEARPALAKILVESDNTGDAVSCVVKGRVASDIDTDGLYVCAYLIENDILRDNETYFQVGIDDAADDAPDDLAETFRHNGIIRIKFHNQDLGDLLTVDPDTREFRVDFGSAAVSSAWNAANCEVVAFICRIDKENLAGNYVLNAGGTRWNEAVESGAAVSTISNPANDLHVYADHDGFVRINGNYTSAAVYSLSGQRHSIATPLQKGIYLVCVNMPDGSSKACKIAVR